MDASARRDPPSTRGALRCRAPDTGAQGCARGRLGWGICLVRRDCAPSSAKRRSGERPWTRQPAPCRPGRECPRPCRPERERQPMPLNSRKPNPATKLRGIDERAWRRWRDAHRSVDSTLRKPAATFPSAPLRMCTAELQSAFPDSLRFKSFKRSRVSCPIGRSVESASICYRSWCRPGGNASSFSSPSGRCSRGPILRDDAAIGQPAVGHPAQDRANGGAGAVHQLQPRGGSAAHRAAPAAPTQPVEALLSSGQLPAATGPRRAAADTRAEARLPAANAAPSGLIEKAGMDPADPDGTHHGDAAVASAQLPQPAQPAWGRCDQAGVPPCWPEGPAPIRQPSGPSQPFQPWRDHLGLQLAAPQRAQSAARLTGHTKRSQGRGLQTAARASSEGRTQNGISAKTRRHCSGSPAGGHLRQAARAAAIRAVSSRRCQGRCFAVGTQAAKIGATNPCCEGVIEGLHHHWFTSCAARPGPQTMPVGRIIVAAQTVTSSQVVWPWRGRAQLAVDSARLGLGKSSGRQPVAASEVSANEEEASMVFVEPGRPRGWVVRERRQTDQAADRAPGSCQIAWSTGFGVGVGPRPAEIKFGQASLRKRGRARSPHAGRRA